MTQSELHRAIARSTGEAVDLIARWGFSLVDQESPLEFPEDDLADYLDWDAVQADRNFSVSPLPTAPALV